MKPIKIEKLDNNSETAIIKWDVKHLERITKGQRICRIETLKTIEDIQSDQEGIIYILDERKKEIPFDTVIAYIFETDEEITEFERNKNG